MIRSSPRPPPLTDPELSIVMPCLNEAETLERCIAKARGFLEQQGIRGEIVVADNGSSDGSSEIALACGARVVHVAERGYGNALRSGIEESRAPLVIIGDADDSYDFSALHPFVEKLNEGFDLVMGNRFRGGIKPDAMPWLHRWVGNPVLTAIGRVLFRIRVGDFHCGLRAFRRDAYDTLHLQSSGMEFASEMVIKSALHDLRITEVPTVLYPDGRTRASHLRTWRDGWRHLRFMLLLSPRWLFLAPGILSMLVGGAVLAALASGSFEIRSVVFDIHTMFVAGLLCILGSQLIVFSMFTEAFAVGEGYHPPPRRRAWIRRCVSLESGAVIGALLACVGLTLLVAAVLGWRRVGYGELDPRVTMRWLIPGSVLFTMGLQAIFSSFFLGILGLRRRREGRLAG